MSRSVIAKLFFGSLIAIAAAVVLVAIAVAVAVGSSSLTMHGQEVVGVQAPFGWAIVLAAILAGLVFFAGSLAQLVAWIGALIETAPIENKAWFIILLVAGLLGFGLIAMLVYLLAEPGPGRTSAPTGATSATVASAAH
jgi:hypothetical protein